MNSRWRQFYVGKVRESGVAVLGCGAEKESHEIRMMSRFDSHCSVCGGDILAGDWIFYNPKGVHSKRSRHAPSGYKTPDRKE